MQTGAMDAAMTSSTSLISFRLEELAKSLTTGRGKAYWFMLEPVLMSKEVYAKLPADQQKATEEEKKRMEEIEKKVAPDSASPGQPKPDETPTPCRRPARPD